MENLKSYEEIIRKYHCYYDEKAIVSKFKRSKYTFDNKKDDMTVVCLFKFKGLDSLTALVQYNHRINYKVHACIQFMQPVYLDNQLNLHISNITLSEQCFYNMDKETILKDYNWTMSRLNREDLRIDKVYYKDSTKVFVDNNIFKVMN